MNKIYLTLLSLLFPALALAQDSTPSTSSISFAPPPSDYSVVFLGNIFGVVDGVLHGSGSQIMGAMFSVFNSAVLALGGIIIMYTLLVSTINTAHEGQMLGQKWSSIWVPMRSTLGLALLIPKASGYCLMQIFVMWVVIQGVGAADKVWQAALSYLNRGGVIVQAQINPMVSIMGDKGGIATGASAMLSGQVCMLGLQTALTNVRQGYLNALQKNSGPCSNGPSKTMQAFCQTSIPDFLDTVNAVTAQTNDPDASIYTVPMPNFNNDSLFAALNGICGSLTWKNISEKEIKDVKKNLSGISSSELDTAKMSRAIAIQQMFMDLSTVAQSMIGNNPVLNPPSKSTGKPQEFSKAAIQQFGVPLLSTSSPCDSPSVNCVGWGSDPSSSATSPIFNGTEFQGAVTDYNAIMMPTITLMSQAANAQAANAMRTFIEQAQLQGWIMAGSYFIDLAQINSANMQTTSQTDTDSGLDKNSSDMGELKKLFSGNNSCQGTYSVLCEWFQNDTQYVNSILSLIDGTGILSAPVPSPTFKAPGQDAVTGQGSSTVFGYIINSSMLQLPGQPGIVNPPQFALSVNIDFQTFHLQQQDFPCGQVKILLFTFCLGEMLGDLFYNYIFLTVFNLFLSMMASIIKLVVLSFLSVPLQGMAQIFNYGVAFIEQPNVNPVIALANMGVNYINFANDLWIYLLMMSMASILIPWFGMFIFPLLAMVMPLLVAWLSTMVGIGFTTAYFVPFLPYMIFTFGTIAWLIAVIEAMVAAPIVALGITHPEGEGAFGKGEQAIMILMNVFLRPAMMIIGYIAAIALSYVSIWVINAGFSNISAFIQGTQGGGTNYSFSSGGSVKDIAKKAAEINTTTGYTGWAGIYGFFFSILIYTMMYVTVVTKAFTLITYLPDKVLRWIGGHPESLGQEATQWSDETKSKVGDAGRDTSRAAQQMDKQMTGYATKAVKKAAGAISAPGTSVDATPGAGE